jgi:hypothetical protein
MLSPEMAAVAAMRVMIEITIKTSIKFMPRSSRLRLRR